MKNLKTLFLTLGAVGLLGACSNEDVVENRPIDTNSVSFTSNILFQEHPLSRVTENNWDANDAIGVYALKAGTALDDANIFDGKSNVKHITKDAGKVAHFVAESNAIQLKTGDNIDVIGYYPHVATVTNYTLPINVKDQSNLAKIDLLYSKNLKGVTGNGAAKMEFTHQLSQISFVVEPGNGFPNVDGVKFGALKGLKAEGSMNLKDGVVTLKEGAAVDLNVTGNKAKGRVIVVPGQKLDKNVSMILTLDGKEFTWFPKQDYDLTSGKKYTFRLQLSADGSVITLNPSGEIVDWIEGNENGDVDVITPGGTVDPEPSDAMPIADFAKKYAGATAETPINITEDIKLKGIVTSDDTAANVFKKLYIQDATGAITIGVNSKEIAQAFARGQEIEVSVKGLDAIVYGGVLQIGLKDAEANRIEMADLKERAKVITADKPIEPTVTTIGALKSEMLNTLIKLENVSFTDGGKLTYAEPKKNTNRDLTDGTNTIIVRNSGYSKFAGELLPEGGVTLTALLDQFDGKWQLTIRDLDDVVKGGETPEPGKDVTVDKTALSFEKEAGEQTIALTADTDVAWTIENADAWLNIAPKAGKGNQTITVKSEANTGTARTGVITIKGGAKDVVVNVSQAGAQEGVEQNIFTETFGKDIKVSKPWKKIANYTNYDNKDLIFSDPKNNSDIRSTSQLDNHVWFPSTDKGGDLVIEGFDITGYTSLSIEFDTTANVYNEADEFDVANIGVYFDNTRVAVPSKVLTKAEGFFDNFYTIKLENLPTNFKAIKFIIDNNKLGVRITNIKLSGTK